MNESGSTEQVKNPDPRTRNYVDCCWNCRHCLPTDKIEHEDSIYSHYCLMDGCDVSLFQVCRDWVHDA